MHFHLYQAMKMMKTLFFKADLKIPYQQFLIFFCLMNLFLFSLDLNRGCLVYMFSLRFSGSKFLIKLRRQFRVCQIFRAQNFGGFAVFPFCI